MNEKTGHYLNKCLRNKPPHTTGTLLGVMMGKNEGDYAPILLLLALLFLWLLWVAVWMYLQLAAHAGPVSWPSSYSDLSAPPSPNPKLQPRLWHHKQARLE